MTTFEAERNVLDLVMPLLREIYGDIDIDPGQRDKPDAAIVLRSVGNDPATETKKIGIEITTVDQPKDMQYLHDEKFSRQLETEQLQTLAAGGVAAERPNKKISIGFSNTYISDGVALKANKHQAYNTTGQFDELVVLAFSSQFNLNNAEMCKYHSAWCSYHLSCSNFPFDKVIFASTLVSGNAVVVYDKKMPTTSAPELDLDMEAGTEFMKSPILRPGVTFNIRSLFEQAPLLKPKTKK